jgi:hypothetical protein
MAPASALLKRIFSAEGQALPIEATPGPQNSKEKTMSATATSPRPATATQEDEKATIKSGTTHRIRRSAAAVLLVATALVAMLATAGSADAAAAGTVSDRGWSCPGNQVIANAPFMTSLNGGYQNVHWAPVVQKWVNGQWVTYRTYNYESGMATSSGSSSWVWWSGQPSNGHYTVTVDPGYWYGSTYYPTYYRVVDYYQWADLNNNPITGWGSFVSGYAYCSF